MMNNISQMNKMLESVNKEMNAGELSKVMDRFEQVRINCSHGDSRECTVY